MAALPTNMPSGLFSTGQSSHILIRCTTRRSANCLKAMLDKPPKTKFNVTQTFALFSTVA
jgi:hypothetical protein